MATFLRNLKLLKNIPRYSLCKPLIPTNFLIKREKSVKTVVPIAIKVKNYATIWKLEKINIAFLLPLIPIGYFMQDKIGDTILAIFTCLHMHSGLICIKMDYVSQRLFGKIGPILASGGIHLFSALVFLGLLFLIHLRGQGIVMTIRKLWAIEPYEEFDYEYLNVHEYEEDFDPQCKAGYVPFKSQMIDPKISKDMVHEDACVAKLHEDIK